MSAAELDKTAAFLEGAAKLGGYTNETVKQDAFARLLVMGRPKTGKTTALLATAPSPCIVNCDGDSATKYAASLGARYAGFDVNNVVAWRAAPALAKRYIAAGARTIVIDSLSILADRLVGELSVKYEGFDLWRAYGETIMSGIYAFLTLEAHVIFVSHMTHGHEDEGLIPMIAGKAAGKIPAVVHDIVRFDFNDDRPEGSKRQFLVGPQKDWTYAGRNVKRTCAVPATIPALFAELGIAL